MDAAPLVCANRFKRIRLHQLSLVRNIGNFLFATVALLEYVLAISLPRYLSLTGNGKHKN